MNYDTACPQVTLSLIDMVSLIGIHPGRQNEAGYVQGLKLSEYFIPQEDGKKEAPLCQYKHLLYRQEDRQQGCADRRDKPSLVSALKRIGMLLSLLMSGVSSKICSAVWLSMTLETGGNSTPVQPETAGDLTYIWPAYLAISFPRLLST